MAQQVQPKFFALTTHDRQLTIEKTGFSRQVWSHGASTFKKGHKTAKIPALRNLTHICICVCPRDGDKHAALSW